MPSNHPLVLGSRVVIAWTDGKTYDAIVTDLKDGGAEKPVQMRIKNRKTKQWVEARRVVAHDPPAADDMTALEEDEDPDDG